MCTGWAAVEQRITRGFQISLEYLDDAVMFWSQDLFA